MNNTSVDPKLIATLSYITPIGWLAALLLNSSNKSSLGSFHIRQSLGIWLLFAAARMVIGFIPFLGWIVGWLAIVLAVLLWFIGLMGAINDQEKEVPALGKNFQEWFQGL